MTMPDLGLGKLWEKLTAGQIGKIFIALTILSGLLIFSPQDLQEKAKIDWLTNEYSKWISLYFLASSCLIVVIAVWKLFEICSSRIKIFRFERLALKELTDLTAEEKVLLSAFIQQDKQVLRLPYSFPPCSLLRGKKILTLTENSSNDSRIMGRQPIHFFNHAIQPIYWKIITNNRETIFANLSNEDYERFRAEFTPYMDAW